MFISLKVIFWSFVFFIAKRYRRSNSFIAYLAESKKDLMIGLDDFLENSVILPPGDITSPDLLKNISRHQRIL